MLAVVENRRAQRNRIRPRGLNSPILEPGPEAKIMPLHLQHALGTTGIIGLATAVMAMPVAAQETFDTDHHEVRVETLAQGLEHPWGLALLPDGRFLVTERNPGHLRIGTAEGELSDPVEGVPEIFRYEGPTPRSQAGLFDVLLHPEFEDNQLVYVSLSLPTERGTGTAIVRGRLVEEGGRARLEEVETIFEMNEEDQDSSGLHFGGRMAFHPEDGSLFLTVGERRNISRSQDPSDQAGSIIRVMDDGSVPGDNPFVDEPAIDDKIYSWGHRNPQGLAFHPETGELWANDHGPQGGDEINRIEAGNNYGWPFITAGKDYSDAPLGVGTEMEGMTSAIHHFEETVAPSGLLIYGGEMFPQWQGHLLNGGLAGQALVRVAIEGDDVVEEEWMLEDLERRIRHVVEADDGSIWLLTEHEDGEVLRLSAGDGLATD
jgi:aldose sugar dehydrogenase